MNKPPANDSRSYALVAFYLAITLPLAFFLNIWADEASTLYTTESGFLRAFQNAAANEKQAPLYFWIMGLWRMLNGSIFFARLFSVICAAVAIKVFSSVASKLLPAQAAFIATAFFALHPVLIWAGLEIRVYALVILLSVLLIKFFLDADWSAEKDVPWRSRVGFLITAIVALYTNYYLAFLLAGLLVALIFTKKWRATVRYAVALVIAIIIFAPLAFTVASQLATNTSGFQVERTLFEGVQILWRHFLTFVLPAGIFTEGESPILIARLWIVRLALLVGVIFAVKNRLSITTRTLAGVAAVASIFLGLLAAYFMLGPVYVEIRHAAVLFVPVTLLLGSLLSNLFQKTTNKLAVLAPALIVLLFFAYSLVTLHPNMTKRGDWARVGAFIEQNEKPGQPILVFTTFDALALPYYYRGENKVLPDEKYFTFNPEAEVGSENSLVSETEFAVSEIPPDAKEMWLVVNEKCIATDACKPLQKFVEANYTIEIEQQFYLEKVFLLRKKT